MNNYGELLTQIQEQYSSIIADPQRANYHAVWQRLLMHHPTDIAQILDHFSPKELHILFLLLPTAISEEVFDQLSLDRQVSLIHHMSNEDASHILRTIPAASLVKLFEQLPDEDLDRYLALTQKQRRQAIIASLERAPETAGRLVNSDILTLPKDFTIQKSVAFLQRSGQMLQGRTTLFLKDEQFRIAGYIEISDLVLNAPDTPLSRIMHPVTVTANVLDDQEKVARLLKKYDLSEIPILDDDQHFLGTISAQEGIEVIEEEMEEDSYKMSGLVHTEHPYEAQGFWRIVWERSSWLAPLLLFQSVSGIIMARYSTLLQTHAVLVFFLTMLVGTGGNAGNQSATLMVRGLVTGEINSGNLFAVLLKELGIALALGAVLFLIGGIRVAFFTPDWATGFVVCFSLMTIVVISIMLGTLIPILLNRIGIDPAHSAAPFIATLMDIVGIMTYCTIAKVVLGY